MKNNELIEYKNYNIIKNNILNSAKFNIELFEYRIILAAMSKIKNTDINNEDIETIEFTIKEFNDIYYDGKANKVIYTKLKKACEKLITRSIIIELEKKYVMIQWIKRIDFPKGEGKIAISFHDDIKPFILYMKNNEYTKYIFKNIVKMKSVYSIRIYELLKQYQTIGERTFKLNELKEILGLNKNNYKQYGCFKLRVLEAVKKEIAEKSDIIINYEEITEAKKVIKLKFHINKNPKANKEFVELSKDQLCVKLNNFLSEKLGYRYYTSNLMKLHRIILIDLIKVFREGCFPNIKFPKKFVDSLIKDIQEKYVLDQIKDY